jgi:hypothetical protein
MKQSLPVGRLPCRQRAELRGGSLLPLRNPGPPPQVRALASPRPAPRGATESRIVNEPGVADAGAAQHLPVSGLQNSHSKAVEAALLLPPAAISEAEPDALGASVQGDVAPEGLGPLHDASATSERASAIVQAKRGEGWSPTKLASLSFFLQGQGLSGQPRAAGGSFPSSGTDTSMALASMPGTTAMQLGSTLPVLGAAPGQGLVPEGRPYLGLKYLLQGGGAAGREGGAIVRGRSTDLQLPMTWTSQV